MGERVEVCIGHHALNSKSNRILADQGLLEILQSEAVFATMKECTPRKIELRGAEFVMPIPEKTHFKLD